MKISIVIPNYNGEELLKKNLPFVLDSISDFGEKAELIVVDDGSDDGSLSFLETFADKNKEFKVKILKNEKNLGFSSTVNKGVNSARGEFVCLLNTDIEPKKNFLTPLIPHFQDEKIAAVGILDRSEEDGKTIERGRGIGSFKRGFLVHGRGELDMKITLWASGGSSIWKKSIWIALGGLDEIYNPFYWEDIDLSYRALKSDYKIAFEPNSVVIHRHHEGAIKKTYSRQKIKKIAYRNQIFFVWKNVDFNNLVVHVLWLPYHFAKSLLNLDLDFIFGFLSALLKISQVVKSRSKAKRLFTKKDSEVIKKFTK